MTTEKIYILKLYSFTNEYNLGSYFRDNDDLKKNNY